MPVDKPVKESIALFFKDEQGRFSAVKRSMDDDSLPGVWGLVGGSLRDSESPEDTVKRSAKDKLGIEVEVLRLVGEDSIDRGEYINHLREYEVKVLSGHPAPVQYDPTVSKYADFTMSDDPEILRDAAEKGSLCSRIYLRQEGLWE